MKIKATAFIRSAEFMLTRKEEVDFRNCVSRAYYGAFHDAIPLAAAQRRAGRREQSMGMHERLIQQLVGKTNSREIRSIGVSLRELRELRVWADYDLERTMTREQAGTAVTQARDIRKRVAIARSSKPETVP